MLQPYYAFYWTYPVPWAGFTRLSRDIEKAVTESRTIRYSRAVVHAHLRMIGGVLVPGGEVAEIERYADRGTIKLGRAFGRLLQKAESEGARVAIVKFSAENNWRYHRQLEDQYRHPACDPVEPGDVLVPDEMDPFKHFEWRRKQLKDHRALKDLRIDEVMAELKAIDLPSWPTRAKALNEQGSRTLTGRCWDGETLRHFVKKYANF